MRESIFEYVLNCCKLFANRHVAKVKLRTDEQHHRATINIFMPMLCLGQADIDCFGFIAPYIDVFNIYPQNDGLCIQIGISTDKNIIEIS